MPKKRQKPYQPTDKERIYCYLAYTLGNEAMQQRLHHGMVTNLQGEEIKPVIDWRSEQPNPGDVIMTGTNLNDGWTFARVIYSKNAHECCAQEIGGSRRIRIENERFYVLRNLNPIMMLEGKQYKFYQNVSKATQNEDWHLFCFIEFKDENAIIWFRERYGGLPRFGAKGSKPYSITIPKWTSLKTQKAIREFLEQNGWKTREWEPNEPQQPVSENLPDNVQGRD